MKRRIESMLILAAIALPTVPRSTWGQGTSQGPVKVFILAGQSNMEGQGVADLDGKDYNQGKGTLNFLLKDPAKRPLVKHLKDDKGRWAVREDVWVRYQPEDGPVKAGPLALGFTPYGGRHHFGPELQFGWILGDYYQNQVLLIKTAWGGKSLYRDFRPPSSGGQVGPYYTKMIAEVRAALANLKNDFPAYDDRGYELAGLVWYQGWNDGCEPKTAVPEYEANLVNLIKDIRKDLNAPRLPVVIGELTGPWVQAPGEWGALRRAQAAAAARPEFRGNVLFVETHDFVRKPEDSPCPGHGHHEFANAETYFLVGNALGEGMKQLISSGKPGSRSATLNLIPWPTSIIQHPNVLHFGTESRIVAVDPQLRPLAEILAGEIQQVTGRRFPISSDRGVAGDIVLQLDTALNGESYVLDVAQSVEIRGGNYGAIALGTATLLQSLIVEAGQVSVPCMSITDAPATEYRGLMVDVARRYHSIENLKQMVQLCRLYKIRYLQLHLTDDQSFMFPSRAYPQLAGQNQHGGKTYTIEQLKDLVAYADARNVTIIPEYEVPGHSAAAIRALPGLFRIRGTKPYEHHASINFAKDEVMQAVDTIVGEMCAVFKSSPYFHIGGDEADLALADQNEDFKAAFRKYHLPDQHQLYRKFVSDMNAIVKKHGKRTIVWEGFGREPDSPVQIPKDVIVMAYEIRFYMPDQLAKDGYQVINASWTPLYVVNSGRPPAEVYAWNPHQFKVFGASSADVGVLVPPGNNIFGAQMCAWEQPESAELANERFRLPAMSERIWNPTAGRSYEDFERRLAHTDRLLGLLVHRFAALANGQPGFFENRFENSLNLTLLPSSWEKENIRYTLDGTEPTATSPAYTGSIQLTDTTNFRAQMYDTDGRPTGYPQSTRYEFRPIRAEAGELLPGERFAQPIALKLTSAVPGQIHYTLDGKDPDANSPTYASPITIERTATVKARLYTAGRCRGEPWTQTYTRVNYEKNLTTGKPVTASSVEAQFRPENAVDGIVALDSAWWAAPYPQWLQVDLEQACTLERIQIFPYWDGIRYYRYTVQVSLDGETWTQVADMSKNTRPATPQGEVHRFKPTRARYIRVNMLKNSANPGVHLVEIRAYVAK